MPKLSKTILNPLGLRGQIGPLHSRATETLGVAALFRQLLQSQSAYVIQLAALGSGLMRDKKAVALLEEIFLRIPNTYTLSAVSLP